MTKKNLILLIVGLTLVVWGGWYLYQQHEDEQTFKTLQTEGEEGLSAEDWARLPGILEEKYKADTYGSTTPEGTLVMFVEALKAGDADLAAKYFIPEKQVEYEQAVTNWTNLGKNTEIAETLSRATDQRINNDGSASMGIFDGDISFMTIYFLKNNFSGKWKIQSL